MDGSDGFKAVACHSFLDMVRSEKDMADMGNSRRPTAFSPPKQREEFSRVLHTFGTDTSNWEERRCVSRDAVREPFISPFKHSEREAGQLGSSKRHRIL